MSMSPGSNRENRRQVYFWKVKYECFGVGRVRATVWKCQWTQSCKACNSCKRAALWHQSGKICSIFPKPWGPQTGDSMDTRGGGINRHLVYCHCTTHWATLPLSWGRSVKGRGEQREAEERRAGKARNYNPVRGHTVHSDCSLSCPPLVASWTEHRPVASLRTLLLQKDESSQFPKKTMPLLCFSFQWCYYLSLLSSPGLFNTHPKALALHAVTALYLAPFQGDALRKMAGIKVFEGV